MHDHSRSKRWGAKHRELIRRQHQVGAKQVCVRTIVYAPRVEAGHKLWMRGAPDAMGAWSKDKSVPMVHVGNR